MCTLHLHSKIICVSNILTSNSSVHNQQLLSIFLVCALYTHKHIIHTYLHACTRSYSYTHILVRAQKLTEGSYPQALTHTHQLVRNTYTRTLVHILIYTSAQKT